MDARIAVLALVVFGHALGCGGRAYDISTRTVSCGRVGFGDACVERGVEARRGRIRACYEEELAYTPGIEGQITIELTVEPDGEATGVHASDDTLGNAAVRECVLAALDDLRFVPGSSEGATVHTFPLVFEPRR